MLNSIFYNNIVIFILSILLNIHLVISGNETLSTAIPFLNNTTTNSTSQPAATEKQAFNVLPTPTVSSNVSLALSKLESEHIQSQIHNIAQQLDPNKKMELSKEKLILNPPPIPVRNNNGNDNGSAEKGTVFMRVADKKINPATVGTVPPCANCKCGVKTVKNFLDGNEIEVRNEFPWTALILYSAKFYCGGSLINDRFVVTAGHCTSGLRIEDILVYLQDYTDVSTIVIRSAINVYRPVGFDPHTFDNDISLIKLSQPVDISTGMTRPICLPPASKSFVGKKGSVTSWELAQNRGHLHFKLLNTTTVQLLSNRQCSKTQMKDLITENMICAKPTTSHTQDICSGDGGGPLMVSQNKRSALAGIISWSLGCEKKAPIVAYTRVTKFIGWIKELTAGSCWCN